MADAVSLVVVRPSVVEAKELKLMEHFS